MQRRTIIACLVSSFLGLVSAAPGCSSKPSSCFGCGEDGGGGSGSSSSSSSATGSSSSSSSHGGTSSGTTSSGSGGGSGTSTGGGTSSSGAPLDASQATFDDAGIPLCNQTPCDLKTNTCCVTQFITGSTCIPHGQACPSMTAAFSCLQKSDCTTSGQVCCGNASSTGTGSAETSCATPESNGNCPGTISSTSAFAQICKQTSECDNGMECVPQTCKINSTLTAALTMCGVQAQAPFNCTRN